MLRNARFLLGAVLLLIGMGCGYMAVAAREAPPDALWAFWLIYSVVGGFSALAGIWLLVTNRFKRMSAAPMSVPPES